MKALLTLPQSIGRQFFCSLSGRFQSGLILLLSLLLTGVRTPAAAQSNPAKPILGVYVSNESADVRAFESWLGQPVDAVLGYTSGNFWGDGHPGWQINLPQYLGGTGRPVLWSIPMMPDNSGDPRYLREAASGVRNGMYTDWARLILDSRKDDAGPIYVRTAWEVGGEWFPFTAAAQADPAAFRGAFQQFAQSFHAVSPRFKMVWDFAGDRSPVEQWYPGDAATDVISQDIYWSPQYMGTDPAAAFARAVNASGNNGFPRGLAWMSAFAAQHGKPMAISEWGVPGGAGNTLDGATFIRLMGQWIDTHNVLYASYWDSEASYDGRLRDNDPPATAAALREFFRSRATPFPLRAADNPANSVPGLNYAYYEGTWSNLPDFAALPPTARGTIGTFDLTPRQRNDDFGFRYTGYVRVPTDGVYTFSTTSDDGSQLFIGATRVVNNDGLHGPQERSGQIGLKAGLHALTVVFFERVNDQVLSVSYEGPGLSKRAIPAAALVRESTALAAASPDAGGGAAVQLFPNPTRTQVTVRLTADANEELQVEVRDALARRVASTTLRATAGQNDVPLLLNHLPAGVYSVAVQRGAARTTKRLVIAP